MWGYFAADIPPVLRIKSGQTVRIDTVSHGGVNLPEDPVEFFAKHGVKRDEILQDALDIRAKVNRPRGGSAHILTGPIYIDEAQPGDMLEVRIIALEHRVPYGVNTSGPGVGVLPELLKAPARKVIRFDLKRNVALFSKQIEIPLQPFMGIMAVAPTKESWMISSRPPWRWGGNMDFNKLTAGATLYLPVFHDGARFYTGDSHAVQGDGEVNGTAIEASLTGTFQFIVHKGAGQSADLRAVSALDRRAAAGRSRLFLCFGEAGAAGDPAANSDHGPAGGARSVVFRLDRHSAGRHQRRPSGLAA